MGIFHCINTCELGDWAVVELAVRNWAEIRENVEKMNEIIGFNKESENANG